MFLAIALPSNSAIISVVGRDSLIQDMIIAALRRHVSNIANSNSGRVASLSILETAPTHIRESIGSRSRWRSFVLVLL